MFGKKDKKPAATKPARKSAAQDFASVATDSAGSLALDDRDFFWSALNAGDTASVGRMIDKTPEALLWRDSQGNLPLIAACWPTTRNVAMAELLIAKGASASDPAAFSAAISRGEDKVLVDLLFDNGFKPTTADLFLSARLDAPHAITRCVKGGIDINSADDTKRYTSTRLPGATALHYAAMYGAKADTLDIILDLGANIDARDKLGRTALMRAISYSQPTLAIKLAGEGANLKIRDKDFQNAFSIAKNAGNLELRRTLVAIKNAEKKPFFGKFK